MLATLLLATLTGVPADDEAPLLRATYDVSDLLPRTGEQRGMRIMPFQLHDEEQEPELSDERFEDMTDVLAELLGNCIATDGLQLEGCSLDVLPGGRLELVAPEAAHHDAAALVGLLRGALRREAVVTLELLRSSDAAPIDPAGIDAALAAGRLRRVVQRTETLWVGSTAECAAETHRRILVDMDPYVAQKSATAAPIFLDLATGLRACLRVEEAAGGRLVLRGVARLAELRELPAHPEGLQMAITGDGGVSRSPALSTFDRPDVAFVTLAASGHVEPGEMLVAAAGSETAHGPSGWVLRLGLSSVAPAAKPAESVDGLHAVGVFDVSRVTWPRTHVPRPTEFGMSPDWLGEGDLFEDVQSFLVFPAEAPGETDWLEYRLQTACEQIGEPNAWIVRRGNWLLACSSRQGLDTIARTLDELAPATGDVVLTLAASRRGDEEARQAVASLRLPLRAGDAGLAWAGSEGLATVMYDMDVAESAAIPDPVVAGFVDGIGLRATASAEGRTHVDLVLHRVLGWERIALGASGIEAYERPLRGVVSLGRDVPAGRSVRLDGLGDPFSPLASLTVEIGTASR